MRRNFIFSGDKFRSLNEMKEIFGKLQFIHYEL